MFYYWEKGKKIASQTHDKATGVSEIWEDILKTAVDSLVRMAHHYTPDSTEGDTV